MGQRYSEEFKESIVKKLLNPGSLGLSNLSRETGIPKSTIATWKKRVQNDKNSNTKLPKNWSNHEKVIALFESEKLSGEELGRWMREKGLHSNYLKQWKKEVIDMSKSNKEKKELNDAKKRIKELESDLRRKEKALAETSALLVLKKKADLIWGGEED